MTRPGPAMVPLMRNRQGRPYAPQHYGHRRPFWDLGKAWHRAQLRAWNALKVRVDRALGPRARRAADYTYRALGGGP